MGGVPVAKKKNAEDKEDKKAKKPKKEKNVRLPITNSSIKYCKKATGYTRCCY